MEEEGGGVRLSKRFSDDGGEVDYKTKSGTAWSHSYLNQKPWHPLSYPNQRRKWIAEQTNANHQRRADEVAREFAQEQEFFRQTALISKKEKEKVEMMKAVSFMYVRPPGYNAESAKAAEIADESNKLDDFSQDQPSEGPSNSVPSQSRDGHAEEKKKSRPKDVFGRSLPTGEEFEILKNAPKLDTGVAGRAKPFGVEVRNVKCLRCGTYGHQSGDRECILKDAIMPNEESRLKRDDPLTAILAHTEGGEPLKWELKQKPGISPPRGGFKLDDPNQQIVAEDIFDEYGGFLSGGYIPELLILPKKKKSTRKSKHKSQSSPICDIMAHEENGSSSSSEDGQRSSKRKEKKHNKKKRHRAKSYENDSETKQPRKRKQKHLSSKSDDSNDDDSETKRPHRKSKQKHLSSKYADSYNNDSETEEPHKNSKQKHSSSKCADAYNDDSETDHSHRKGKQKQSYSTSTKYRDSDERYRSKHHHRDDDYDRDRNHSRHSHRRYHSNRS